MRPWHPEKELPFVTQHVNQPFFMGDGFSSPRRPIAQGSIREVVEVMDHRQLDFDKPDQDAISKKGQPGARRYKDKRYVFDQVFGMQATQEEVFEHTVKPLLPGVLDGLNATAFAYGATGCGKTHTISGDVQNPGVIVRTIEELFRLKEEIEDEITMELSMVEIYNEEIRDLLNDNYPTGPLGGLKMLEKEGQMKIQNVTTKVLASVEEVMGLVMLGTNRRSTSFTHSNAQSSRSHAVLQINIGRHTKDHNVDHEGGTVAKQSYFATLSIIDLAGSERAAATQNQGKRMKEGAKINQSLLSLSNCIHALCQAARSGASPHIPYRNSKLTRMLKFSLGGNCRTVMIVCVSPSSKDIEDTHNTLVWANRAKEVKMTVSRNTAGQPVTARQYLQTIDEQSRRITFLQSQIDKLQNPGPDQIQRPSFTKAKADAAAREAREVLAASKVQMNNVMEVITYGARQRALWDNAEMQIAAYQREITMIKRNEAGRSDEDVAKSVATLEALIQRRRAIFIENPEVSGAVQQEANALAGLQRKIAVEEGRTFGDAIEKADMVAYRAGLAGQRLEMEKASAGAREEGYREAAASQADALARTITLLQYYASSVQNELDLVSGIARTVAGAEDLSPVASRLTGLGLSVQSQLAKLLSGKSAIVLPPLPTMPTADGTASLAQIAHMSPARPTPSAASRLLGPPSRSTPTKKTAAFRVMPAAQRLLAVGAGPGSPGKGHKKAMGSPLRPALRKQFVVGSAHKGRTPKKTARWKDEVGGTIDDRATAPDALVFSSPSESSGVDQGNAADWEEDDSISSPAKPQITPIILPKTKSMLPRASPPTKSNSVFNANPMPPPPIPLISGPSTTQTTQAAPIPEWKRNRMLLGKSAGSRLSPLGEERESSSSPDRSVAQIGLGAPSRPPRSALSERHDNASSMRVDSSFAAGPSTSFFANLARPTASSLAKTDSAGGLKLGAPSRRMSSVGAQRNRRLSSSAPYGQSAQARRSRGSIMPGDASLANLTIDGLPGPSRTTSTFSMGPPPLPNPLGPPTRAIPPSSSAVSASGSGISPKSGIARRSSYMPPPSSSNGSALSGAGSSRLGGLSGPRASISMATLPRAGASGLSSRPSISSMRPGTSVSNIAVAAGDASTVRPWR